MFGFFKNKQTDYQAVIKTANNQSLTVKKGDNLLKAALSAGLPWPHDCRVGSCGTCRCTLVSGKIKPLSDFSYVLTGDQLKSGMILACQTALRSDIEIDVELDEDAGLASIVAYDGIIDRTHKLTHDILEVTIKCDASATHLARAGQYAELATPGVRRARSYSYSKAPQNEQPGEFTFFIRHVPNGEHTDWLFEEDRSGIKVKISGPYGSFYLRDSEGPMLCVAGGSGLAPVKALLEDALLQNTRRDILFLFGARTQQDLYCLDEIQSIQDNWNEKVSFQFVPVLSQEPEDSGWQGERGYVTDYLKREHIDKGIDMNGHQGYLCGPPAMIDSTVEIMHQAGITDDNIFFDKFLDASTMPGNKNREYREP